MDGLIERDEMLFEVGGDQLFYSLYTVKGMQHEKMAEWKMSYERKRERSMKPFAPVKIEVKVGRNDPCPCGSGKKYKKCCG